MSRYYSKSKTYTFYIDIVGSHRITERAIHLNKWYGPIACGKYQCVMCYDKSTLYKLLCMFRDAEVGIYQRIQTGVNSFEYRCLDGQRLSELLEEMYYEQKRFRRDFDIPVPIEEITKYRKGIKPRYGKGTGKGDAHCSNCGSCVCSILYDGKEAVGWFHTTCKCGDDTDYSEAHLYL